MPDWADASFANRLHREIDHLLNGDEKTDGLYREWLSAQNWDNIQITKGKVTAYENVLKLMDMVAQRMNNTDWPSQQSDRSMN